MILTQYQSDCLSTTLLPDLLMGGCERRRAASAAPLRYRIDCRLLIAKAGRFDRRPYAGNRTSEPFELSVGLGIIPLNKSSL